jgi:hypothetical protein
LHARIAHAHCHVKCAALECGRSGQPCLRPSVLQHLAADGHPRDGVLVSDMHMCACCNDPKDTYFEWRYGIMHWRSDIVRV